MIVTYEVEVRMADRPWGLCLVTESPESAERVRHEMLRLGYAAVRVVKVTREVLP